jgi:hypothetical protein
MFPVEIVFSVKLTLSVKTFSRSLVISSGIKAGGLFMIRVSAVFFIRRCAIHPNITNSASPVSSAAVTANLYL